MKNSDPKPILKFGIGLLVFILLVELYFGDYDKMPHTLLALAPILILYGKSKKE